MDTTCHVVVLHNEARNHFIGLDLEDAMLFNVHETDIDIETDSQSALENAAEELFARYNVGDDPTFGTPHSDAIDYRAKRNRSLSVGDVLVFVTSGESRTALHCADFGFKRILPQSFARLGPFRSLPERDAFFARQRSGS
jgi:hypothetical protein